MHFPDLEVCCDWSTFFPLKSADVPREGTLDARLRMSAGEANKKVNSATKIIHLVSVPQVRDNACQETLLIDSEREEKLWKKLVLSLLVHIVL